MMLRLFVQLSMVPNGFLCSTHSPVSPTNHDATALMLH